ncbi:hypothetical protein, partial [Nocardia gipuzkoensis]
MSTPNVDPTTAESMQQDADFADEHTKPTHADEHPTGEELETDESTPRGHSGHVTRSRRQRVGRQIVGELPMTVGEH